MLCCADSDNVRSDVLEWVAYHACSKFLRNNTQEAFNDVCNFNKAHSHLPDDYRNALPKDFQQAMAMLDKQAGTELIAYDICPNKDCHVMVYRCEFKDLQQCPRCGQDRYKVTAAGSKLARKRLLYSPVTEYVRTLWRNPDTARCVLPCMKGCECSAHNIAMIGSQVLIPVDTLTLIDSLGHCHWQFLPQGVHDPCTDLSLHSELC